MKKKAAKASSIAKNMALGDNLFSRFEEAVHDIYAPSESAGKLGPSLYPHQGASRKKPFNISYTSAADGEVFVAKLYPRTRDTVVVSVGGTVPGSSADNSISVHYEQPLAGGLYLQTPNRALAYGGNDGSENFELPTFSASPVAFTPMTCVACTLPAATAFSSQIVNNGTDAFRVGVASREGGTGTWSQTPLYAISAGASISFSYTTPAGGSNAMAFIIRNTSSDVRQVNLSCHFNVGSAAPPATITYPASPSKSHSALEDPQDIDEVLIRSADMLLTCMGDLTTTGGRAVAALVPREWAPDSSDIVGSIASLPNNVYDGKLIDGSHVVWQPREQQDFTYSPIETDERSHYIIVAAVLAKAATSIRLKATLNYEVFSTDPTLGAMSWNPSGFGYLEVLAAVFSAVGPASENSSHLDKLKSALRAVRALSRRGVKFVMENPELAAKAAKIAISML